MISDVLFDAITEIDRCMAEYPTVYKQDEEIHEAIRELQLRMRLLQMQLDKPPAARKVTVNHLDV
jgi:hypothetical protein